MPQEQDLIFRALMTRIRELETYEGSVKTIWAYLAGVAEMPGGDAVTDAVLADLRRRGIEAVKAQ